MLLKDKQAVIYGGGGSVGAAIAITFAREGATVFLSGRSAPALEATAGKIRAAGGKAETALVDALDQQAVEDYLNGVVKKAGRIDISFNAIGLEDTQDIPLVRMQLEDFLRPISIAMRTQFITATAAGRHMQRQGAGVILAITATPAGKAYPLVGGFGPACSAMEGFCRNLAAELGPHGVRVVTLRSAGSPDSAVFIRAIEGDPSTGLPAIEGLVNDTMLRKLPKLQEVADVAAFMASDRASGVTGAVANVTCGTTVL